MKKCKGCGEVLQVDNPNSSGYVLNIDQDYCQRCFRLIHYGDNKKLLNEKVNNNDILSIYDKYKDSTFVLIVDCFDGLVFDLDNLLDAFKTYKIILIINKIDLLPRNIKDEKLEDLYYHILQRCDVNNLIDCLLTYKYDDSFKDLFFRTISSIDSDRFIFVGRANAGKSTIINKLIGDNVLTTSTYPGTTVKINEINVDNYSFIDTPGLKDDLSYVYYVEPNKLKYLCPNKCIKPKVFQLYEPQSYIIEGLLRVDIYPKKNSSITFIIKNEIEPHRTKLENAYSYIKKHEKEFKLKLLPFKPNEYFVNDFSSFYLKGLGFIKIKGSSNITIHVNDKIRIYRSEVNI